MRKLLAILTLTTAMAFAAIQPIPASAQGVSIYIGNGGVGIGINWWGWHNTWNQRCYRYNRQWQQWCNDNNRFRSPYPDQGWQHSHNRDRGHQNDRP